MNGLADLLALVSDDDGPGVSVGGLAAGTVSLRVGGGTLSAGERVAGGAQDVFEHGAAGDLMRDLGQPRTHARALARGEDDDADRSSDGSHTNGPLLPLRW